MMLTLGEFRVLLASDFLFKTGSLHYEYDFEYMHDLVNAITAYMINRSFENSEEYKFGVDNLMHFYNNKANEKIDIFLQKKFFSTDTKTH